MNRALLLFGCFACGCAHRPSSTAEPTSAANSGVLAPEQVVSAGLFAPESVAPGAHGELLVELEIAKGYHVMSDHPSRPLYIATAVAWEPRPGIVWHAPRYPRPKTFRLEDEEVATFDGTFEIRVPFEVAKDAKPGDLELAGVLSYQACTRGSCLFPVKRALSTRLRIAP